MSSHEIDSFEGMVEYFQQSDFEIVVDEQQQAVEIPTHIGGQNTRTVLVWDPRGEVLRVIQPLLETTPKTEDASVFEAIARVNHVITLGAFGYDIIQGMVYFRWAVPRNNNRLTASQITAAVNTVLFSCRDFLPALGQVMRGELASAEVLSQVQMKT